MKKIMFDTNVFNVIVNESLDVNLFIDKGDFYITHLQLDEIQKTPDEERRKKLLEVFNKFSEISIPTENLVLDVSRLGEAKIGSEIIATESAVYGISKYGRCNFSNKGNFYTPIKDKLDRINKSKPSNIQDALIAETCIKNGYTLITHDKSLYSITTFFHGACANIYELID
jgi:predicted nucleic acid-binding protein